MSEVAVLGAGLAGCCASLRLAAHGHQVVLIDKANRPVGGASLHNEGKLHLGYTYAAEAEPKTYRTVAVGALRFLRQLEGLTGVSESAFRRSAPFVYAVPNDSQRAFDDVLQHFDAVDDFVESESRRCNRSVAGRSVQLDPRELTRHFSSNIAGAVRTPEFAIDSHQLAAVVGAAVLAHPNITFRGEHTVGSADRHGDQYVVEGEQAGGSFSQRYRGVVNALWEARTTIDASIGIVSDEPWMWRWKATISFDGAIVPTIPAVTALVGTYGDVVEYGERRTYLSWYPACLQGRTNQGGLDPLQPEVAGMNRELVFAESVKGMARLVPAVGALMSLRDRARIGGGYIMALGTSDIDSPSSGLHERHRVGVLGVDGWRSIETGKLCTAPGFGIAAADEIHAYLEAG